MNQKIELVIFDWDGTLFDSAKQIVASLQFAAQQFEQPLTDEAAKSIIGLGLPEVMQTLFPHVPHLHQNLLECYADHYVTNSIGDAWFSGVAALLADLKQAGLKLAVATGKSRRGLDRVLTQTNSHQIFDMTRAASETKSKPDPLMLQEILTELDVPVEAAIMVGDTSYDLEMAQNLKMRSIGVSYGAHTVETLQRYQPLVIVDDIQSLHDYLTRFLPITIPSNKCFDVTE